jgi:hypothetical protein
MASDTEGRIFKAISRWIGGAAGTLEGINDVIENPPPRATSPEPRHESTHFEHSDLSARGTFIVGVSVLAGMWIIVGLLYFYFAALAHREAKASPPALPIEVHGNPTPPEPRLQQSPRQDLKAMRAREDWELNHYSWVNKSKGTVAIPIERAIEIVAQRGIPPQKAPSGLVLSQPQAGSRLTGFEGKVEPEPR